MLQRFIKNYPKEILAGVVLILAYIPTLIWMWDRWFVRDTYYSHGILVPFVTGYLIWQMRDELKLMKRETSFWGLWLVGLGILVHLVSSLLRVYFTSGFSMLVVLSGLILHFWGVRIFWKIAFPIGFLVFMVPLPIVAITELSFKLKIMAAQVSTYVLNHMGIVAIRDGSMIMMRHAIVTVEDVCSGLRSLITLMALGTIFAYWFKGSWIKKIILVLSTIPIAIATNVCRILLLAVLNEVWGTPSEFVHDLSGYMVFVLAFIMLMIVSKALES